jgi:hypothetical protein
MHQLSGEGILKHVDGIIHEDTQVQDDRLDLTVKSIYHLRSAGRLDFGGSEFESAATEKISPVKESIDDDYGWWKLEEGSYRLVFNEDIADALNAGTPFLLPHTHLIQAGALLESTVPDPVNPQVHPTLSVGPHGIHIKENARIASLVILSD